MTPIMPYLNLDRMLLVILYIRNNNKCNWYCIQKIQVITKQQRLRE